MARHAARRGEEDGTFSLVTVAVIAVVVLLLGLVLYAKVYRVNAGTPEESVCRTSIRTHSLLLLASEGEFAAGISCEPVQYEVGGEPAAAVVGALAACRARWDAAWTTDRPLYAEKGVYCNPCGYLTLGQEVDGLDTLLERTPAPDGMMSDYLFPVEGSWQAAKPRFASLPAGRYAVLFYYIRDEAPVELRGEVAEPLQLACIFANILSPGSCSKASAQGLDWAGDWLRSKGFYISALFTHSYGTLAQAGSTGTVDEPSWAGAVLLVPNDDVVFSELGCERVSQRAERSSRITDV